MKFRNARGARIGLGLAAVVLAGAWGGCIGDIGGDGTDDVTVPDTPDATELGVGPMGVRRLSVYEYDNTIRDLLGDDTRPAKSMLPEDSLSPFDNDFEKQQPSRVLVESAELVAADVAQRFVAEPARRDPVIGCTPTVATDTECFTRFVETFGRRALRRPLTTDEVSDFVTLGQSFAGDTENGGDFYVGIEVILRAFLQSADFLYRVELGTPVEGQPGMFRLNDYELGSRMSFLIWGAGPSEAVLDLAESGSLADSESRRAAAVSMLSDDRALSQVDRFHAMWLSYAQMPLPAELTSRMRGETSALIDRVVFQEQGSWFGLFQSTETYVDDTLAAHYGFASPGSSAATWVDVSAEGRQGILSHGTFLSAASNPADTSPTKRGVLIRERLLCEKIGPPDPEAPADMPPDPSLGDCKTDQYAANRAKGASCQGCHANLDFIGFGLENYDMSGQFRDHDDGKPECAITGEGEVTGLGTFNGPAELSDLLVASDRLDACAVQHLLQFAMGRETTQAERAFLDVLQAGFRDGEYRFDELVLSLVSDEAFAYRLDMEEE